MRRWGLGVLLGVLASGCGNPLLVTRELAHGGQTRAWHLYRPPSAGAGAPLVVALHGGGGRGAGFDDMTRGQITRAAAKRGWVVVFPEGVEKGWNDGRAPVSGRDRRRAGVDDVGFITALVEAAAAEHGIDRGRVYVMGISNGGFMAQRYAIEASDRVAAIAAVTAQVAVAWRDRAPSRPVPVLLMNGTKDPLVPYGGGQVMVFGEARGEVLSTAESVAWWARHDGCAPAAGGTVGAAAVETVADGDPEDGTRTVVERVDGCAGGSAVVLYRVEGGGHGWPGGEQYLPERVIGRVSGDFDAAEVIFGWFEGFGGR
ncbi:MAG: esterase [Myxococcales bacterium]|nr:esterase [Myxococcales bacterium]